MDDRQPNIAESIESLISHMNGSRRLFLALIVAAFILAPTSVVFAAILLLPDLLSYTGPEYTFTAVDDYAFDDYYEDGLYGEFAGEFVGSMFGDSHAGEDVPDASYFGEFVGEFDGQFAVMSGEFTGMFDGEFERFYDDGSQMGDWTWEDDGEPGEPHGIPDGQLATLGTYDGSFEGTFTGEFYGMDDPEYFAQNIDPAPAGAYDVEFAPDDEYYDYGLQPRFMAIDDELAPFQQTDITLFVVAFAVIIATTAGVMLYVALRELLFYSDWNSRFKRYSERKKAIDDELGD